MCQAVAPGCGGISRSRASAGNTAGLPSIDQVPPLPYTTSGLSVANGAPDSSRTRIGGAGGMTPIVVPG